MTDSTTETIRSTIVKLCSDMASILEILKTGDEKNSLYELGQEIMQLLDKLANGTNMPSIEKVSYISTKIKVLFNVISIAKGNNPLISDVIISDVSKLNLDMSDLINQVSK